MNIPVVALRNLTVIPGVLLHFDINRPRSVAAVEKAMNGDEKILMVMQKDENIEYPGKADLETYGTVGTIKQLLKLPDNIIRVLVEGNFRAELIDIVSDEPYLEAEYEEAPYAQDIIDQNEAEAMTQYLKDTIQGFASQSQDVNEAALRQLIMINTLDELMEQAMIRLPLPNPNKQALLNMDSTYARYHMLVGFIHTEMQISSLKNEISRKVKDHLDENQREYVLREQLRIIREELGEDEKSDADKFEEQVKALKASDEVKEKIRKEIRRFTMMQGSSQEGTVSRTYIETLLEMPWDKTARESRDIAKAERILDEDHYGLEKIKERIIEHLAVRNFTGEAGGTILCLVGPPGTGKTSIARSIARALNKKYVRVSLGGVRDEAEIRGHRRTYIGAMPGRIAVGMKQAGVANPLMLLDEIDKVSSDYKGDTSSALLEVLDSEQNVNFHDHYIDIPIDLSRVMFIATANTTETIPRPLLDRMELIEVSSYTENEKFHIAKDFLVAKQLKKNGLKPAQLTFTDKAIRLIIHSYTREAGVRTLERRIGDICRKAARQILGKKQESIRVTEAVVRKYLGKEVVRFDAANEEDQVGIVRGLAWTSVGGDTLEIEVNMMPGSGKLQLTGQLGDVMKESAMAGLTYVRSIGAKYDIADDFFDKHDIHLHIPEGAVPKDGPSAGVTMATAILSAAAGIKVRADVAMTGEITLRGRVLPIGGLKEKLLAAKQAGIRRVLVPADNERDVAEISHEITGGLDIRYVSGMEEVLYLSLCAAEIGE